MVGAGPGPAEEGGRREEGTEVRVEKKREGDVRKNRWTERREWRRKHEHL